MNFIDKRDEDILDLLSDGFGHKEVAKKMGLSPRTVEARIVRMRARNHCRTTVELCCKYVAEQKDLFFLQYQEIMEVKTLSARVR